MPPRNDRFNKLNLVPVGTLRKSLESHAEDDTERATLRNANLRDLIQFARTKALDAATIDDIYEEGRYSRRLSFHLFYITSDDGFEFRPTQFFQELAENHINIEQCAYEDLPKITNISYCDQVEIEQEGTTERIREIRFKYHALIKFVSGDDSERPSYIYETRYGFIWINQGNKYLVVISSDDKLVQIIHRRLTIENRPVIRPNIPRDIIDNSLPEELRAGTYVRPDLGLSTRISSTSQDITHYAQELEGAGGLQRSTLRFGTIDEEENKQSCISYNPQKYKLTLYGIFRSAIIRSWGVSFLNNIFDNFQEHTNNPSNLSDVLVSDAYRGRSYTDSERHLFRFLIGAFLGFNQANQNNRHDIPDALIETLPYPKLKKYFTGVLNYYCEECEGYSIPSSASGEQIHLDENLSVSIGDNTIGMAESINIRCHAGHARELSAINMLSLIPKEKLNDVLLLALNSNQFSFDSLNYFISEQTLHINLTACPTVIHIDELDTFRSLPALVASDAAQRLTTDLKEKCDQSNTENCTACPTVNTRSCLMKVYHYTEPNVARRQVIHPHHGHEYGDFSFEATHNGTQRRVKVLLKSHGNRTITAGQSVGKDIATQVLTQYLRDQYNPILLIHATPSLDPQFKADIINVVKYRRGNVIFVETNQSNQIIEQAIQNGLAIAE